MERVGSDVLRSILSLLVLQDLIQCESTCRTLRNAAEMIWESHRSEFFIQNSDRDWKRKCVRNIVARDNLRQGIYFGWSLFDSRDWNSYKTFFCTANSGNLLGTYTKAYTKKTIHKETGSLQIDLKSQRSVFTPKGPNAVKQWVTYSLSNRFLIQTNLENGMSSGGHWTGSVESLRSSWFFKDILCIDPEHDRMMCLHDDNPQCADWINMEGDETLSTIQQSDEIRKWMLHCALWRDLFLMMHRDPQNNTPMMSLWDLNNRTIRWTQPIEDVEDPRIFFCALHGDRIVVGTNQWEIRSTDGSLIRNIPRLIQPGFYSTRVQIDPHKISILDGFKLKFHDRSGNLITCLEISRSGNSSSYIPHFPQFLPNSESPDYSQIQLGNDAFAIDFTGNWREKEKNSVQLVFKLQDEEPVQVECECDRIFAEISQLLQSQLKLIQCECVYDSEQDRIFFYSKNERRSNFQLEIDPFEDDAQISGDLFPGNRPQKHPLKQDYKQILEKDLTGVYLKMRLTKSGLKMIDFQVEEWLQMWPYRSDIVIQKVIKPSQDTKEKKSKGGRKSSRSNRGSDRKS
eukprot:TRINITY_DN5133_c0_g1_i1.p1 TRINITY_DN5133_c0_g1~~TRINITY_DN5133_c0_g1_i1.p1  ORF type:complete len:570 (+),score=169.43 TRINITY_DN5133_c0_g1_i1:77-1786(+)